MRSSSFLVVLIGLAVTSCADDSLTGGGGSASTSGGNNGTGASADGGASQAGGAGAGASPAAGGMGGAGPGSGGAAAGGAGTGGSGGGEPAPVVRFVAIGDAGKANQGQLDVANAIAAKCALSGCDFVQLLGDNIYDSGVESANDRRFQLQFEQPYASVDLPFFVVLGNHDYGGDGAGWEFEKGQYQVDYTQISSKWTLPAKYYHHSLEHVEFFGFDTNMAMYLQADDQAADFPGWIAASTATWKIAFAHHPYLSNGPHGNAGEYEGLPFVPITNGAGVKELADDVICGNVDLYISGHDHSLQWLQDTCAGTELIVSGAGASSTELDGDNPTHFESLSLGFLYVRIEGNTLAGEFYDTSGGLLFSRTLTK